MATGWSNVTRTLALLGAGSVADSTLDVVARHPECFRVAAVAAHRNWRKLATLCARFRADVAALLNPAAANELESTLRAEHIDIRVVAGPQ